MKKQSWILILWIGVMIFPLNWLRRESIFIRQNFESAFQSEWVHVAAHLILFAGLVILLLFTMRMPQNGKTAVVIMTILLMVAFAQELLQLQVKGRGFGGPEWFDVGVDMIGGLIGWWVYQRVWGRRWIEKRTGTQSP
jgi:VanZ family protein